MKIRFVVFVLMASLVSACSGGGLSADTVKKVLDEGSGAVRTIPVLLSGAVKTGKRGLQEAKDQVEAAKRTAAQIGSGVQKLTEGVSQIEGAVKGK